MAGFQVQVVQGIRLVVVLAFLVLAAVAAAGQQFGTNEESLRLSIANSRVTCAVMAAWVPDVVMALEGRAYLGTEAVVPALATTGRPLYQHARSV